ncbi:serine-threonine protein kinase, partial [Entamoeba invadens IP1]
MNFLVVFFLVLQSVVGELSYVCFNATNSTINQYFNYVVNDKCGELPFSLEVEYNGSLTLGGEYFIKRGLSKTINSDRLSIIQMSRQTNYVDVNCDNPIYFEEGHGLKSMYLLEYGDRSFWSFNNSNLPPGFLFLFGVRANVWAPTNLTVLSSNSVYMHSMGYQFFYYVKQNIEAFVYFKGYNSTEYSVPFVRTARVNKTTQDCVYQFSFENMLPPDVDAADYKMIPICERKNITRYVQCFWSKGLFTDCSCQLKETSGKVKTSSGFNYPDCKELGKLFDFELGSENTYIVFDTVNTTHWADMIIPQRMTSLTFVVSIETGKALEIDNDFSLPTFPFTVYGGLHINGQLTIETAAEYIIQKLSFSSVEIDKLIDEHTIILSSILSEKNIQMLEENGIRSICGGDGYTKRFAKESASTIGSVGCKCEMRDETSFVQFDCNETSLEEHSQLDLVMSRSEYNGGEFERYWHSLTFSGNGYRTLKGLKHVIANCVFSGTRNYVIDTVLICESVTIEDGVNIHVKNQMLAKHVHISGNYNSLTTEAIFSGANSIDLKIESLQIDQITTCVNFAVAQHENFVFNGTHQIGEYTLVETERLQRVCITGTEDKHIECTIDGP